MMRVYVALPRLYTLYPRKIHRSPTPKKAEATKKKRPSTRDGEVEVKNRIETRSLEKKSNPYFQTKQNHPNQ